MNPVLESSSVTKPSGMTEADTTLNLSSCYSQFEYELNEGSPTRKIEVLERCMRAHHAARIIQNVYRNYKLRSVYNRICIQNCTESKSRIPKPDPSVCHEKIQGECRLFSGHEKCSVRKLESFGDPVLEQAFLDCESEAATAQTNCNVKLNPNCTLVAVNKYSGNKPTPTIWDDSINYSSMSNPTSSFISHQSPPITFIHGMSHQSSETHNDELGYHPVFSNQEYRSTPLTFPAQRSNSQELSITEDTVLHPHSACCCATNVEPSKLRESSQNGRTSHPEEFALNKSHKPSGLQSGIMLRVQLNQLAHTIHKNAESAPDPLSTQCSYGTNCERKFCDPFPCYSLLPVGHSTHGTRKQKLNLPPTKAHTISTPCNHGPNHVLIHELPARSTGSCSKSSCPPNLSVVDTNNTTSSSGQPMPHKWVMLVPVSRSSDAHVNHHTIGQRGTVLHHFNEQITSFTPSPEACPRPRISSLPTEPSSIHPSNKVLPGPKQQMHVTERKRKRMYRIGLNTFNKSPIEGIKFLIKWNFIDRSADGIARFLLTRKGLSRIAIGDYLGNTKDELAMAVTRQFMRGLDFRDKDVDEALRSLLSCFRTPGESQKIVHLLNEFQVAYIEQNHFRVESQFRYADSVMVLAYAIIMLHTDMYSPNIRQKSRMTRDEFVRNLRGIDGGDDLDRTQLLSIYDRIQLREMSVSPDHTEQVRKIQQYLTGPLRPLSLSSPQRRLVCYCRLYEVTDLTKKERPGAHQREVFLFNDLLLITKAVQKKRRDASIAYQVRYSLNLLGMRLSAFETPKYPHGLQLIVTNEEDHGTKSSESLGAGSSHSQARVLVTLNTKTLSDRTRFVEDLQESIIEVTEMNHLSSKEVDRQKRNNANTEGSVPVHDPPVDLVLPNLDNLLLQHPVQKL